MQVSTITFYSTQWADQWIGKSKPYFAFLSNSITSHLYDLTCRIGKIFALAVKLSWSFIQTQAYKHPFIAAMVTLYILRAGFYYFIKPKDQQK